MTVFRFADRALGIVSVAILARLLSPDDFGLVAMAMAVVGVVELLGAFGFDVAIIQKKDVARAHLDTVWTLSAALGLFNAALVCLLAYPAAAFYGDQRLVAIMLSVAAYVAFGGFTNVGVVLFRKEMRFRQEFIYLLSRRIVGFVAAISLAYILRSYWALVIGSVVAAAMGVGLSFAMHPYRPQLSLSSLGDIFGFSKWLFLNNLLLFIGGRSSDFIIGKFAGPSALGMYNLALEISTVPTVHMVAPINRVTLAAYARVTGSLEALRAEYSRVLAFVTLFVAPAGVGISVTASPLVTVLLGEKWLAAIPLVELLGLFGAVSGVSASNGMVYLSIGRSSLVALLQASYVVVLVPTLIFATIRLGTLGAAWAVLACTLLFTAVDFALLLRVLNMGVLAVARVLWRPLLASLAMWGIVSMVDHLAGATVTTLQSFARLILLVGTGAVTYCALVTLLWLAAGRPEGAEKVLQRIIRMRLARTG